MSPLQFGLDFYSPIMEMFRNGLTTQETFTLSWN